MNRVKILFCLFLLVLSLIYVCDYFKKIDIISFLLSDDKKSIVLSSVTSNNVNTKFSSSTNISNKRLIKKEEVNNETNIALDPIVYIYNTHETEEYKSSFYNITPTVKTVSNIMKDELLKLNINSIIETKSVQKEVNKRGLDYPETYTVSLEYLKARRGKNPSLKYFFDMHRDSVVGDVARVSINNKKYATIMFLVGTKNQYYKRNLKGIRVMEKYLNNHYKGLLRSTYYQPNSTFYQDYDSNMFLVELGGPDNTLEEIYNSTVALSKAIKYYVEENK